MVLSSIHAVLYEYKSTFVDVVDVYNISHD